MPLPAPVERIDEEQQRIGRPFPAGLRARLARSNGGDLFIGDEGWTLFPVWDPSSKRSAGKSAGSVARETAALYAALGNLLAPGLVAIAENGSGDYLMLDQASRPTLWRHEENSLELVDVAWDRDRPRAPRRSHRVEAVDRVTAGLAALGDGSIGAVVIEAPGSGIYVQFTKISDEFVGESIGERNLTKLHAFRMSANMQAGLPKLGWSEPDDSAEHAGNWTQRWSATAWDPKGVARLVVRTFEEVYGLEAAALAVVPGQA